MTTGMLRPRQKGVTNHIPISFQTVPINVKPSDTQGAVRIQIAHCLWFLTLTCTASSNFEILTLKLRRDPGIIEAQRHRRAAPLGRTFAPERLAGNCRTAHSRFSALRDIVVCQQVTHFTFHHSSQHRVLRQCRQFPPLGNLAGLRGTLRKLQIAAIVLPRKKIHWFRAENHPSGRNPSLLPLGVEADSGLIQYHPASKTAIGRQAIRFRSGHAIATF